MGWSAVAGGPGRSCAAARSVCDEVNPSNEFVHDFPSAPRKSAAAASSTTIPSAAAAATLGARAMTPFLQADSDR
jgi:hypothetical protein